MPAARGALAEVPVCNSVQPLRRSVVTCQTHAHTHTSYQLAISSQKLTLALTLYDPGIPEHTLLTIRTLQELRNEAFSR